MLTKYLCITFIITIAFVKAIPINSPSRIQRYARIHVEGLPLTFNPNFHVQYDMNGYAIDAHEHHDNGHGGKNNCKHGCEKKVTKKPKGGFFDALGKNFKKAVAGGSKIVQSAIETGKAAVDAVESKVEKILG